MRECCRNEQEKNAEKPVMKKYGVADGARTHDHWNHNPGLYQLSYSHRREGRTKWRARQDSNLRPPA